MEADEPATQTRPSVFKDKFKTIWTAYDKTLLAIAATILAAGISFGSALLAANMTRNSNEAIQYKQFKQTQYVKLLGTINTEIQTSYHIVESLLNGSTEGAFSQVQELKTDNTVTADSATLFLYGNKEIESAALECANAVEDIVVFIDTSTVSGSIPETRVGGITHTVPIKLRDLEIKATSLQSLMKKDLDLPG